ncbi:MAG: dihydroxyacetone kinase subunit L [Lachnospiraceae bacterium]|jgi:dihydroxyacetone kinase-like protein|nr:dihydroxyacetone kinase subunit L [Lachnospiraceae bacterium]MCI1398016.1 dihydroxyacetone kinase subunit L [Lachnospiraceae bacterium]MCI1424135.1 dihydroxyacetone kinase subunit L [Lachnospiraceae bacterium]MCI1452941.1 dihydroxyacetone kinase subunit L [Lachnospiraceae bacterium]
MSTERITKENVADLFQSVAEEYAGKKEELCEMDAQMGDGDLGLTMAKGFGALPGIIRDNLGEADLGRILFKAGMKMSGVVPSTMGTLMASGLMSVGRALSGKQELDAKDLAAFLAAFAEGIHKRGKCEAGDRTIYDALLPAAESAGQAADRGGSLADVIDAACEGAEKGVEATKEMIPKYGKAAVFSAKAKGVRDQGAVAGLYLLEGMKKYLV